MKSLILAVCLVFLGLAVNGQDSHRCGATTSKGTPCKMRVKAAGAKCYHHSDGTTYKAAANSGDEATTYKQTAYCGATTQKGTPCKRRVRLQGLKCHDHNHK